MVPKGVWIRDRLLIMVSLQATIAVMSSVAGSVIGLIALEVVQIDCSLLIHLVACCLV